MNLICKLFAEDGCAASSRPGWISSLYHEPLRFDQPRAGPVTAPCRTSIDGEKQPES
jgi:hypothetical protein